MSRTHELGWPKLRIQWPSGGRWAWNWQYLDKHARTYSVANAYEIDHPYRGSRSVVLRIFGTRGIVFHHWETNPESLEDDGNGRWVEHHLARALSCQKGSQRFQDSVTVDDEELDIHMEIYDTPEDVPFPAPEGFDWVPTDTIKAWLAGKSDYTPPVQSPVYHNNDEDWYDW